jgi:hypothetical protein
MNAPFQAPARAPDITLPGATVEQLFTLLNNAVINAVIFAKVQDGSMRPFIDPQPVIQVLGAALQAAQRPPGETDVQ